MTPADLPPARSRLFRLVRAWWPALRLRVILFSVLLFAASLPGFGALFLRVYENTLVRQTEAELIAQGAAIAGAAAVEWPGAVPIPKPDMPAYRPERLRIDLRTSHVYGERPAGFDPSDDPDPKALKAAARVAPIVRETTKITLASIRITDAHGIVVLGQDDEGLSYAGLPEVRTALAGRLATLLRRNGACRPRTRLELFSRAACLRVHHARPVKIGGKVVAVVLLSRSPRGLFVGIYEDRGKIVLGLILILIVLVGMAAVLNRAIARPIAALARATADVARGAPLVPDTPALAAIEIRALYDDFRAMAARIERRGRYLKDFAAAVSHEFKTPIAGIKGAIELLEEHGGTMSERERTRFLANAAADADRLSHLVQRLLDLARADMAVRGQASATALAPLLHTIADAQYTYPMAIEVSAEDGLPPIAVPAEVIEAAMDTLIENSRQAGARRVTVTAACADGHIRLAVTDDGSGIPPGDRDRLFAPFFTSRRADGGTGMGLAIARSLLAASGAAIELVGSGTGARFVLELPLATVSLPQE